MTYVCDLHLSSPQTVLYPLRTKSQGSGLFDSTNNSSNNEISIPNINTEFLQKEHKSLNVSYLTDENLFYYIAGVIAVPRYSEQYGSNLISSHHGVPILNIESLQEISAVGRKLGEPQ